MIRNKDHVDSLDAVCTNVLNKLRIVSSRELTKKMQAERAEIEAITNKVEANTRKMAAELKKKATKLVSQRKVRMGALGSLLL